MKVTASKLRANTRLLKIAPKSNLSKLGRLKKRNCLIGDPESIVHMDWLKEWSELK